MFRIIWLNKPLFCAFLFVQFYSYANKTEATLSCFGEHRKKIEVSSNQLAKSELQWKGSCYAHPPSVLSSAVIYRRSGKLYNFSEEQIAYCGSLDCGDTTRQICNRGFFISGYSSQVQDSILRAGYAYTEDPSFDQQTRQFIENSLEVLEEDKETYQRLLKELELITPKKNKTRELTVYQLQREIKALKKYKELLEKTLPDVLNSKDPKSIATHQNQMTSNSDQLAKLQQKLNELAVKLSPEDLKKKEKLISEIRIIIEKHGVAKKLRARSDAFFAEQENRKIPLANLKRVDLELSPSSQNTPLKEPEFVGRLSCTPEENDRALRLLEKAFCLDFPVAIT